MINKIVIPAFIIVTIFAIIGAVTTGLVAHEYSHKQDFKEISNDGYIALFVIPDDQGFIETMINSYGRYQYSFDRSDSSENERINQYTEYKAYFISFAIAGIFVVSYIILMWRKDEKES